jgi:hypothetical protein
MKLFKAQKNEAQKILNKSQFFTFWVENGRFSSVLGVFRELII